MLAPHSHRSGLDEWLGAVAVLLVAGFYAFGLPFWSGLVMGEVRLHAGEPFEVVEGLEVTPGEGWRVAAGGELFTTLTKDGASLVFSPVGPRGDVHRTLDRTVAGLENDPNNVWDVGAIQGFTTDAGDTGWSVGAFSPTTAQVYWVITNGNRQVTIVGRSPDSVWAFVSEQMDDMVRSVVFTEASG